MTQLTWDIESLNTLLAGYKAPIKSFNFTKTGPGGSFTTIDLTYDMEVIQKITSVIKEKLNILDTKIKNTEIDRDIIYSYYSADNPDTSSRLIQDKRLGDNIYAAATKILMDELEEALKVCPEYSHPVLANPLRAAFKRPEMIIFKISPVQKLANPVKGFTERRLYESVTIQPEKVAGTPEDLADAVVATRTSMDYGNKLTGKRASTAWYSGLYRIAREGGQIIKKRKGQDRPRRDPFSEVERTKMYWQIIRTRLEELGNKPAYWYLLNYGNKNHARMSASNKGGVGQPENQATHFVEKAATKIAEILANADKENPSTGPTYISSKQDPRAIKLTELANTLKKVRKDYVYLQDQITNFERYLRDYMVRRNANDLDLQYQALGNLDKILDNVLATKIVPLKINEKLSVDESQIVEQKLNKFVLEVLADKPVPARLYIIGKDSVELKLRTKNVIQSLQKELDQYKKEIPMPVIEKLLEKTSATLATMMEARKQEIYLRNLAKKVK